MLFSSRLDVKFLERMLFDDGTFKIILGSGSGRRVVSTLRYTSQGRHFVYGRMDGLLLSKDKGMGATSTIRAFMPRRSHLLAPARGVVLGRVTSNGAAGRVTTRGRLDFRAVGDRQGGVFHGLKIGGIRRTAGCTVQTNVISLTRCCVWDEETCQGSARVRQFVRASDDSQLLDHVSMRANIV